MTNFLLQKAFLTLREQQAVYAEAMRISPGFYRPTLRNGAEMSLLMNCLGYHWSSRTYRYTTMRDTDDQEAASVPRLFQTLAGRAVRETGFWPKKESLPPYDICIVNWYDEELGKLGVHADNSETAESLAAGYPVLSLSIGASCVFTMGGLSRKDAQQEYVLDSGDLVLFGRSLRLAYHGVKKIIAGTTPPELGFAKPGRLNLTLRIL